MDSRRRSCREEWQICFFGDCNKSASAEEETEAIRHIRCRKVNKYVSIFENQVSIAIRIN